jgi:hypothetical protein
MAKQRYGKLGGIEFDEKKQLWLAMIYDEDGILQDLSDPGWTKADDAYDCFVSAKKLIQKRRRRRALNTAKLLGGSVDEIN